MDVFIREAAVEPLQNKNAETVGRPTKRICYFNYFLFALFVYNGCFIIVSIIHLVFVFDIIVLANCLLYGVFVHFSRCAYIFIQQ